MPWWFYLLIAWALCGTVCAWWFGLAMSNAEVQDQARKVLDEGDSVATGTGPPDPQGGP